MDPSLGRVGPYRSDQSLISEYDLRSMGSSQNISKQYQNIQKRTYERPTHALIKHPLSSNKYHISHLFKLVKALANDEHVWLEIFELSPPQVVTLYNDY
jgi:hypothetical protein